MTTISKRTRSEREIDKRDFEGAIFLAVRAELLNNVSLDETSSRTEINLSRKLVARVVRKLKAAVTIYCFPAIYDSAGGLEATVGIKNLRTDNTLLIG